MSTSLTQLLESISPERTLDEMSTRVDAALNSFRPDRGMVKSWEEFQSLMTRFQRHVESTLLRAKSMPEGWDDFYWSRCANVLRRLYSRNGELAAFDIARTGNEGGLRGVLREVAISVGAEYTENEISARILHWWNAQSPDELMAAMDDYLERFGHLLPSELTEGCAARIRVEFRRVLEQHHHLLHRLSRVGR